MSAPRISAIIPVRNRCGVRLRNCLASLRWQNVAAADVEIVVSDFGSDPDHARDIAGLAEEFDAGVVRVETDEIWNRSRALNVGIQRAMSPLLFNTDADMIFAPNFVATLLERLRLPQRIVFCRCHDLPEDVPERTWEASDYPELLLRASLRQTTGTGACQAAQRSFFRHARGYDERFVYWGAEDDDMRLRAIRYGLTPVWASDSTSMLHQWHPTMKGDKPLRGKINKWRMKLTSWQVVKNRRAWGSEAVRSRG